MPRQRFIWPTLWEDPAIGRLSDTHRVLYIGCFSLADDEGRIIGEPAFLRSHIFPYHKISDARVKQVRDEVDRACPSFCVYVIADVSYIAFLNWSEFQRPKYPKPSKLPEPLGESSPNLGGSVEQDSPVGWVGLGRDGLGRTVAPLARRDELWDVLVEQLGDVSTKNERAKRNGAVKQLRDVGATPDEVRRRCDAYRIRWPGADLTDMALVNQWSQVVAALPAGTAMSGDQITQALRLTEGGKQ